MGTSVVFGEEEGAIFELIIGVSSILKRIHDKSSLEDYLKEPLQSIPCNGTELLDTWRGKEFSRRF